MSEKKSLFEIFVFRFFFLFTILFILTLPFPFSIIPDPGSLVRVITEPIVKWIGIHILNLSPDFVFQLTSDSTGLYILVILLLVLSLILAILWTLFSQTKEPRYLHYWFLVVCRYYLSLQLLIYGFSKVFKVQFYLPEPNTLFTNLGDLSPDILFWSVMGISPAYSFFMGIVEVMAALLLLFGKTRLLGACLSFAILLNVVAINLSYDISVKIHSSFLLLLSLIIISPDLKRLSGFFFSLPGNTSNLYIPLYKSENSFRRYIAVKTLVISVIFFEVLYLYFLSGNFNDDTYPRPSLHGAYKVKEFILNGDTLAGSWDDTLRWKRAFVHRKSYLIVENMQDEMKDYKMMVNGNTNIISLTRNNEKSGFLYMKNITANNFLLEGKVDGDTLKMIVEKTALEKLPALQKEFYWTVY